MGDIKRVDENDLTQYAFTDEQKKFLKETVAPGMNLTDNEMLLYAYICKKKGADPFLKQIIPVKFKDEMGKSNLAFITTIEQYRIIAEKTGTYGGSDDYLFDEGLTEYEYLMKWRERMKEKGGGLRDEDEAKIHPHTATATIFKIIKGQVLKIRATARWTEYLPVNKKRQFMWWRMPFLMLGKCAEGLALRKGWPYSYERLYVDAEFDKVSDSAVSSLENNQDIIDRILEMYDVLGYNEAQKISRTTEACGVGDLYHATRASLEVLAEQLEKDIKGGEDEEN